jgi:hypothetical protein
VTILKHNMPARDGTTILEVIFAIFVVIVGLLGIASIIPLAARNASDSNAHNNAQALGQRWFQGFFARGLYEHDGFTANGIGYNWQWFKDYPAGGVGPNFVNFEKSYQSGTGVPGIGVGPGANQSPVNSLSNTSGPGAISRIWGHQGVCIDPTFFTEPDVRQRLNAHISAGGTGSGTSRVAGYRLAVFPYFDDGFNPVTDPYSPSDSWQDQPRMMRVSLGFGAGMQVSRKLVEDVFASPDDLAITTYAQDPTTGEQIKDDTFPATRIFQTDTGGTVTKPTAVGEYSWLATVSPAEPRFTQIDTAPKATAMALDTSTDYLISLVVMHRRDKQFIEPGVTPTAGSPDDKPAGERLVWVVPLSGNFSGGNGGRVRLIANAAVDDTLHIGDWIMLGKHYMVDGLDATRRYAYFRWYRIIAVDQETKTGPLSALSPSGTDPYGAAAGQTVWARDVVLEGPDFNTSLTYTVPPAGPSFITPMTGTLMQGVVTVVERSIRVD